MSCYHPVSAWRYTRDEKFRFTDPPVFEGKKEWLNTQIEKVVFPCGKCIGCRIDKSKDWAVRCVLEASLYEENCFVTLTYNNDSLPSGGSLDFRDLQLFMKRLRKKFSGRKIRYYAVGEYGKKLERPHFHIILFGFDFADKWLFFRSRGQNVFRSSNLESLWPHGFSTVGAVSLQSCAYVARYVQKKFYGSDTEKLEYYGDKVQEQARMSLKPGIASDWFTMYSSDVYPKDFIVIDGKKYKPSKYFDKLFKRDNPDVFMDIKEKRFERFMANVEESTPERLAVREECFKARIKKLHRGYEEEEGI